MLIKKNEESDDESYKQEDLQICSSDIKLILAVNGKEGRCSEKYILSIR